MEAYYRRFGYRTIGWREAPAALKLKLSATRLFSVRVLVMCKP